MPHPAIEASGLSKRYRLGAIGATSLREETSRLWSRIRGRRQISDDGDFWALRDVSFAIEPGEIVGVIGRNGAGKSTLLKILSRITDPTEGRAVLRGRIASLLEVGTGFHPDLSGRENIYLNGAILGMSRGEIRSKFDEIVAFSEVEKFIDTPVKRYSSGMYVRLAFAVAAHLEPEILLVDEVLAVGDAAFQQKCLGKMREVSRDRGRTIVFVSHNMAATSRLCSRGIWIDGGRIKLDGPAAAVCGSYLSSSSDEHGHRAWPDGFANPGVEDFRFLGVSLINSQQETTGRLAAAEAFTVEIRFQVRKALPPCRIGFLVATTDGALLFDAYDCDEPAAWARRAPGDHTLRCTIPANILRPGRFLLNLNAGIPNERNLASIDGVLAFDIDGEDPNPGFGRVRREGALQMRLQWSHAAPRP